MANEKLGNKTAEVKENNANNQSYLNRMATAAGNTVKNGFLGLMNDNTENYEISRAASVLFFVNTGVSKLSGGSSVATNFSLLCTIATGALAVKQYGLQNSTKALTSGAVSLFNKARNYVNPPKGPEAVVMPYAPGLRQRSE